MVDWWHLDLVTTQSNSGMLLFRYKAQVHILFRDHSIVLRFLSISFSKDRLLRFSELLFVLILFVGLVFKM